MPVSYRKWFIQRLTDEYEKEAESRKKRDDNKGRRQRVRDLPMGEMATEVAQQPARSNDTKSFK